MQTNNNLECFHRLGEAPNGQSLYELRNKMTNEYTKYLVPKENADKFEKLVIEAANTDKGYDNPQKVQTKILTWGLAGSALGAGLCAFLTRKSSTFTKVFSTVLGSFAAGLASVLVFAGTLFTKVYNMGKQFDSLGVKPYEEKNI